MSYRRRSVSNPPCAIWRSPLLCWMLACLFASFSARAEPVAPLLRRLLLTPGQTTATPVGAAGVDASAIPALRTPEARRLTATFLHRPIDDVLVDDIRRRLIAYYTSISRPFVDIVIPAQDVSTGTLVVQVQETRVGAIRVDGNHWFDAAQYAAALHVRPGDPIDTSRLFANVEWLNRNPHRQAKLLIGPGQQPGTYDLTVQAQDKLPLDVTLAADNTGTNETGLYRLGIDVDWSNALWRGDDLNYDFLTSTEWTRLRQHIVSYTANLPSRDTLTLLGTSASTTARLADTSAAIGGHADTVSLRYAITLPGADGFGQRLDLGYDYRSTNTNVLTGGTSVFATASEIDQFVIDYGQQRTDRWGATGLAISVVGSPGGATPGNRSSAFAAQQPDASAQYAYGRLTIERVTNLLWETLWVARLTAQYSSGILLPTEQLVFGGVQSIRGFVEQGALRDTGAVLQNEWRGPPIRAGLPAVLQGSDGNHGVVPFAFLDLGAGRNRYEVEFTHRSWLEMVSIGPGFTFPFAHAGAFRFSWGFPLVRNGHVGPLLGPQFGTQFTF